SCPVLGQVRITDDFGERAVVPDGAGEGVGDSLGHDGPHNAVTDTAQVDGLSDGTESPHAVYGVQVLVMAQKGASLRIDLAPEGGPEEGGLDVVHGEGVAAVQAMDVSPLDQLHEGVPPVPIEDEGRPHDPQNEAPRAFMLQEPVKLV